MLPSATLDLTSTAWCMDWDRVCYNIGLDGGEDQAYHPQLVCQRHADSPYFQQKFKK